VFPELKRLERKYAKELVVIGVHSAKFPNEKDSECIREAIVRHGIEHPVVNDSEFVLFRRFGARGWPHFVLVDPAGDIVGHASGEGNYEVFVHHIDLLLKKFADKLDRKELTFTLEKSKMKEGALLYPGKILATADRLFIADTNHHRILVTDHAGKVVERIGGPQEGLKDGDFAAAQFYQPQGLALAGDVLYIADTENHVIRAADLKARRVTTVAGTGKMGYRREGGPIEALKSPLSSPWDLALDGKRLFIAMAGSHQIWAMDLEAKTAGPFSGSGRERLADGPHAEAAFNQPSGLAVLNGKLYVADSEVSGVREVDLEPGGSVRTVVGTGLFDFGDMDGVGDEVKMQHVLGIAAHGGRLLVADAYNHKIRTCDPKTRGVKTFLGDGKRGKEDGKAARFYEPSGLAVAGDKLFIADQNNHAIRVCDLKTGEVSTLPIEKK
jgi:DNA-binding beta-propeller fold protein YncE